MSHHAVWITHLLCYSNWTSEVVSRLKWWSFWADNSVQYADLGTEQWAMVSNNEDLFSPVDIFSSMKVFKSVSFFFRSGPGRSQAGRGGADHERRSSLADGGHAGGHPQPQDWCHAPACGRRQGLPWGHQVRNSHALSCPIPGPLRAVILTLSL